jgi:hypothetical protein
MITVSNYNAGSGSYSGGSSSSGISSLQEGVGIAIQNPNGPTATIANTGVLSLLTDTGDITLINNQDGSWTINSTPQNPWELPNEQNNNTIVLNCNANVGEYNPSVSQGDQVIAATGADGNERLILTTESSTNSSVEIGGSGVLIGVGGSSSTPQTSITVTSNQIQQVSQGNSLIQASGVLTLQGIINISMQGTTVFQNVATCSATMPASTDSSTIIPTTAWVQGLVGGVYARTYTVRYITDNQVITVPANCTCVDITVLSQGGKAGTNKVPAPGDPETYYVGGGSGAGGTSCILNRFPVRAGQQFLVDINNSPSSGPGFINLYYTLYANSPTPDVTNSSQRSKLAQVYAGGDGEGAQFYSPPDPGSGGQESTDPFCFADVGSWTIIKGTDGFPGQVDAMPTSAGYPRGRCYVDGEDGVGQRFVNNGSNQPATTQRGRAAVYLTYYLF